MGLFSSIGGLFGGNDAADDLQKDLAKIAEQAKFAPFNISSPLSSGNFDGTTGTVNPSAATSQTFADFNELINQTGSRAGSFNPQSFQNEFFRSIDRLESQREAEGFADFESSIFNNSGVSTGSQRQVRDFQESLQRRRFDRQKRAVTESQNFQSNMFNQFLGLVGGRTGLNQAVLDPLRLGLDAGSRAASANQTANQLLTQGAEGQAIATANSGSSIGGLLDGAFSLFGGGFF